MAATIAPVFLLDDGILLLVVDGARRADLGADAALAVFQHVAVVGVDGRHLRHSLRKRDIDGAAGVEAEVELVRDLLLRALFGTCAAAGTLRLVDEAGPCGGS